MQESEAKCNTFFGKHFSFGGECVLRFRTLTLLASNHGQPYPVSKITEFLGFGSVEECLFYLKESNVMLTKDRKKMDVKKSKGKVKEYVPKSVDDQHGVTHGSLVG